MKRIFFLLIAFVLVLSACKTAKKTAQSEYTSDNTASGTKVFTVPATVSETASEIETTVAEPKIADEKPIAVREEQVSFTNQREQTENVGNAFFVIIGSFSQLENAKKYRSTLLNEGFTPIILHSETGYYRVCVNSYKNESEARTRISEVRDNFSKYSDVWLLVKK